MIQITRIDDPFQPIYTHNRDPHHCPRECLYELFCCYTTPMLNPSKERMVTVKKCDSPTKTRDIYFQHKQDIYFRHKKDLYLERMADEA